MKVIVPNGPTVELGTTEANPTIGIEDYSRRVTDDFGVTTVVKRDFSRRMSVKIAVPTPLVDQFQQRLASLRATAAMWVADERFAWLTVNGFFSDLSIEISSASISMCTLTVEGLAENGGEQDLGVDPAHGGASTFQVLQPTPVTDAMLVASLVAENDAPTWAAATIYAKGARVIRTGTHRIYESLQAANAGKTPESEPSWWLDVGPTNRWAMFDEALGTATAQAGGLEVTLNPSAATALSLIDVVGDSVRVRANGYDRTASISAGTMTFTGLPGSGQVIVTVSGAQVAVGTLLIGRLLGLGLTEAAPTVGIVDYSRKEKDDFGDVTVVERAWSKTMSARTLIRTDAVDAVANRIAAMRARPVLWIGQDGQDAVTIYGFFKDFSIEVGASVSKMSLAIEGLSKAAPIAPELPTGGTVAWPDVTDPNGTKPSNNADKTSENTANDTAHIGGRPTPEVLAKLDEIEDIEFPTEAIDLLKQADADRAAAERQMQRALDLLGEAILRVTGEASLAREVMRDAGIVVDPATGKVRIYAVDLLAERTNAQLTLVDQTLDAVNGALISKVERTEFDALATNAGFVEQVLSSAGGRSGLSFTARQARAAGNDGAEAGLRALLAGDEASRRTIVQIAEVRQEVFAKIIDAQTAEAVARQLLNVQIGAVDVRLATEILARIEEGKAFARQIAALGVTAGGLAADIARVDEALIEGDKAAVRSAETLIATSEEKTNNAIGKVGERVAAAEGSIKRVSEASVYADKVNAEAIQQVTARLDDVGGVTIEQKFETTAERLGLVEGRYSVAIDTNGNLIGFQLIGSDDGPGSFNLINTDLRMGTGRVIFNNGQFMRVQGTGFGRFGDLLSWYGPTMALADCTIGNALSGETTNGISKIGGLLVAGRFSNQAANTALGANEVAVLGPFGGAGGQVRVSASWLYELTFDASYQPTEGGEREFEAAVAQHNATRSGSGWFGTRVETVPASTIVLRRTFAGGSEAVLDQASFDKQTSTMTGFAPVRGDAAGFASFRVQLGGGFTVTDPQQLAADRTLRLSLARGINLGGAGVVQRLSIIAIEE